MSGSFAALCSRLSERPLLCPGEESEHSESEPGMALGRDLKRRLKAAIAPLIFLSLVGYFSWNVVKGNHGLVAYAQRQELFAQAQADQAKAVAERDAWERRVAGLRSRHIDADTLDERARAMLNLADPSDVIVPYGTQDRLF
jgi:cell division protein FtsB